MLDNIKQYDGILFYFFKGAGGGGQLLNIFFEGGNDFHFFTPRKRQKTNVFDVFKGYRNRKRYLFSQKSSMIIFDRVSQLI